MQSRTYAQPIFARRVAVAAASLALAVGGLTAAAPTASAAPTGCTSGGLFGFVWARCSGGTGEFRVSATCYTFPVTGNYYILDGNWARPGGISTGFCLGKADHPTAETRG